MSGRPYRRVMAVSAALAISLGLGATASRPAAARAAARAGQPVTPAASPGELPPPGVVEPATPPAAVAQPFTGQATCVSPAHPFLATRMARGITGALHGRPSVLGLAVQDASLRLSCRLNQGGHFDAASAIKVTILSALLLKAGRYDRLTAAQRTLAWEMITESDNDAATALWDEVGMAGMQRFLNRAKMSHTVLNDAWGLTQLTAQDETTLLTLLTTPGPVMNLPCRRYVLWLMAHVIPSQRWGVSAGAPSGVTVHIKNGWLPYPTYADWHVNSLGAVTGGRTGYVIAVLTADNPSMQAGIDTIQAAARVINRDLAAG